MGDVVQIAAPFVKFGGQVVTAFGERGEAEVGAQAQEFAAEAELFNAGVARQEGLLAQASAKLNIARRRKVARSLISTQEALFAKSGVTSEGSPILVMEESLAEAELDILIEQFNADVAQSRAESEAVQAEIRAGQRRLVAGQERTAGRARRTTTLIESAIDLLGKFPTKKKTITTTPVSSRFLSPSGMIRGGPLETFTSGGSVLAESLRR